MWPEADMPDIRASSVGQHREDTISSIPGRHPSRRPAESPAFRIRRQPGTDQAQWIHWRSSRHVCLGQVVTLHDFA